MATMPIDLVAVITDVLNNKVLPMMEARLAALPRRHRLVALEAARAVNDLWVVELKAAVERELGMTIDEAIALHERIAESGMAVEAGRA